MLIPRPRHRIGRTPPAAPRPPLPAPPPPAARRLECLMDNLDEDNLVHVDLYDDGTFPECL
ncbi:hypothetical protein ACIBJF_44765 [Streptomyces sp. NPDC050743]|uniref:hypothetical protein n=1 Tax=Streptomyces sp. NPDC050743 TaxID=3365634 RepID=UPI0037997FAD